MAIPLVLAMMVLVVVPFGLISVNNTDALGAGEPPAVTVAVIFTVLLFAYVDLSVTTLVMGATITFAVAVAEAELLDRVAMELI